MKLIVRIFSGLILGCCAKMHMTCIKFVWINAKTHVGQAIFINIQMGTILSCYKTNDI